MAYFSPFSLRAWRPFCSGLFCFGFWSGFFLRSRGRSIVRHAAPRSALFWIERAHQARHRVLRENQAVVLQHVIRLKNVRSRELDAFDIAARKFEIAVFAVRDEQSRLREAQLVERGDKAAGLVRIELPAVHDGQLFFREFCRKSERSAPSKIFFGSA